MVLYNQSDISSIELGFPEHCKFFAINFHHDFQPLHEDLLRTNWRGEQVQSYYFNVHSSTKSEPALPQALSTNFYAGFYEKILWKVRSKPKTLKFNKE